MTTHNDALLELVTQHGHAQLDDTVSVVGNVDEVRLLVSHRRRILNALDDAAQIGKGPQTDESHVHAALIIHIDIPGHLGVLIIQQSLTDQTVHTGHLHRGELVGIKLAGNGENHLATIGITLRQRHQVTSLKNLIDSRIIDVQVLEPLGEQLTNGQITLEHLTGCRHGELLGAQEAQQKDGISATLLDVRMLGDPLAELSQRLTTYVLVLVQLLLGHLLHGRAQTAGIRRIVIVRCGGGGAVQFGLLQHLGFQHCEAIEKRVS